MPSKKTTMTKPRAPLGNCAYNETVYKQTGIVHYAFDEPSASELVTGPNGKKIHRDMERPLREMIAAAKREGVTLEVGSGFRSKDYQKGIIERKIKAGQSAKAIYHVSSAPGYSEHHTGFAVDFTPISHAFAKSKGYRWLVTQGNAQKFGFYQTFTASYSDASGISEESWHFKYLGTPRARELLGNGECALHGTNPRRS